MLLDKVQLLAGNDIQYVSALLLKHHLIALMNNLPYTDYRALHRKIVKLDDMSLAINGDLNLHDFIGFHRFTIR